MKRKEIEKRLKSSIDSSIPDVLEGILNGCDEIKVFKKSPILTVERQPKKVFSSKIIGAYAFAVACLCICSFLGFSYYLQNFAIDSVVEFDINPSIELKINKSERIVDALPLNDDGKTVLHDMDLKNTDIDVAVNAIVGSMFKNGFITQDSNSILVSVKNNDIARGQALQNKLSTDINEILQANSIDASILSQIYDEDEEVKALVEKYNISAGKAKLISKIQAANIEDSRGQKISGDALAIMSVNELNLLLTSKNTEINDVNKTGGNASSSAYIGEEKAKQIALKHIHASQSSITDIRVSLDFDDGMLVYEVDFQIDNTEYDYEIDAKTGAIVEAEVENKHINQASQNNLEHNDSAAISKEKAKAIALEHARIPASEISELEIEYDKDDGIYIYEIEFNVGQAEYEYEIDAKNGSIIKFDKDIDD